jgi:hypothetical protein
VRRARKAALPSAKSDPEKSAATPASRAHFGFDPSDHVFGEAAAPIAPAKGD